VLAFAFGLVLVRVALQFGQSQITATTVARVIRVVRVRLARGYLGASWALQSGERTGRLQEMVGGYSSNAATATMQLSTGIVALASLVTFMVTAFAVSALAALAVAVTAGALAFVLRPLRNATRRSSRELAVANLAVATDVTETANHVLEVRVFGVEPAVADRIEREMTDAAEIDSRTRFLSQIGGTVYQGVAMLLMVGVVGVLYAAHVNRLGAVGGVVLIMIRSLTYGQSLLSTYQSMHNSAPMLEVLRDELDRYERAALPVGGDPVERIGKMAFDGVSFEYVAETPVLRDVSFQIPHGDIVGIVGPSGAGKSTLVQLVLRLREPTTGRVLADGRDVRELSLESWYERVSFVPQDPALFAGSIADNIRFYRDGVDQADIERAAKLANLHDEVMSWSGGYDTPVGERGGQLSGGQRQRLCIARALVGEPDMLVFDEPTSALDVKSEALIRDTIAGLAPRTTVLVIAHRLSTLSICDRIMVVLAGELQGFDAPDRLEAENPFYREALQLSGLR
jgi:ABC-type multidrug transport system fused ATPase/permease subunit